MTLMRTGSIRRSSFDFPPGFFFLNWIFRFVFLLAFPQRFYQFLLEGVPRWIDQVTLAHPLSREFDGSKPISISVFSIDENPIWFLFCWNVGWFDYYICFLESYLSLACHLAPISVLFFFVKKYLYLNGNLLFKQKHSLKRNWYKNAYYSKTIDNNLVDANGNINGTCSYHYEHVLIIYFVHLLFSSSEWSNTSHPGLLQNEPKKGFWEKLNKTKHQPSSSWG